MLTNMSYIILYAAFCIFFFDKNLLLTITKTTRNELAKMVVIGINKFCYDNNSVNIVIGSCIHNLIYSYHKLLYPMLLSNIHTSYIFSSSPDYDQGADVMVYM